MPRTELYPIKKMIGFADAQLIAIDKWRRRQIPIPSVSEAIRLLIDQALAAAPSARQLSKDAKRKAAELASREIDRLGNLPADNDERARRKRRLIKGPRELREVRGDQSKAKG